MKVLNLRCSQDHDFEGWFGSDADYESQCERGLVACPLCSDQTISRMPTAPRLNLARSSRSSEPTLQRDDASVVDDGAPISRQLTLHSQWLQAVKHVMQNTVDVGPRFAEEARRIHYGEAEERAIRGKATPSEAESLRDEGIDVMALPVPESLKGPLQ